MQEKQKGFWKGVLAGVAACAIVLGASLGGWQLYLKKTSPPQSTTLNTRAIAQKISEIQYYLDQLYLFDEDADQVQDGIYKGMIYSLGDVYADYFTPEEFGNFLKETSGNYSGVGARVNQNNATLVTCITEVYPGSPAEEAGLNVGDVIVAVDGTDVSEYSLEDTVSMVMGQEGTQVDLTVFRESTGETLTLKVTRRAVDAPTVYTDLLPDKTGYIRISEFTLDTGNQFKEAVDGLIEKGIQRIVYDLRGCPGGTLDSAIEVIDYVLPDGLYIYEVDKWGETVESYSGSDGHEINLPTIVMMNGNTASAAELFSSNIRDYGWGLLVGTQSFGKGIVQQTFGLSDGSAIKITVDAYYTKSGYSIHGKGLAPDVVLDFDERYIPEANMVPQDDPEVQQAVLQFDQLP